MVFYYFFYLGVKNSIEAKNLKKYPCKEAIKRVYSEGRTEEETEIEKNLKKDVDRECGEMIYSSSTVRKGSEEVL